MKILIAPDSFKGSLSAVRFCEIAEKTIKSILPDAEIDCMPVADGGEGTLECLQSAMDCKIVKCFVQNSLYEEEVSLVGFIDNGKTAIIEAAQSNGLPQIKGRENPEETSTYGVGQLVAFACDLGARKIILTLGGSSTNDCGLGLLAALGGCFYNKDGVSFVPTGGTLTEVQEIDLSMMYPRLQGASFEALCDVDNPLYGENGCSAVFGPQKGADPEMVKRLDEGCRHISKLFNKMRTTDFALEKGAGAAGGLGFCVLAGLNGKLKSGIDTILSLCEFERRSSDCDLIITGEGSFDRQSAMGKTIGGIIKRAGKVPVVVFCGKSDGSDVDGIKDVVEISKGLELEEAIKNTEQNLEKAIKEYFKNK
ncbi:MAG: glycerate kinase [Treponema sp.]|nr:glycerate kinase [Treponema sp.]MDY4985539.1 glycerate kinase [Treponema sp.]